MTPRIPTLDFLRRDGCELCDEGRLALQQVLEERAVNRQLIPRVRYLDISTDEELERRHLATIPVLRYAGQELPLATSARRISRFLAGTLDAALA